MHLKLNTILVEWNKWRSELNKLPDRRMIRFDEIVKSMSSDMQNAISVNALNFSSNVFVWHSGRNTKDITNEARLYLIELLKSDEIDWFNLRPPTSKKPGRRFGEFHPKAKISDAEIDLLCELREEGFIFKWLADKFEISKDAARKIYIGERRAIVRSKKN